MAPASSIATDLHFEVTTSVALKVLFLEGAISDVDKIFEEGLRGRDPECEDSLSTKALKCRSKFLEGIYLHSICNGINRENE